MSYRPVATSDDGLPTTSAEVHARHGSISAHRSALFARIARNRVRWALGAFVVLVLLFFVSIGHTAVPERLTPATWGSQAANSWFHSGTASSTHGIWNDQQYDEDGWVKGSGRTNLTYDSPFNRDDYSLTEDECDAFFPGLWSEIDRSVEYFTTKQK